MQLTTFRSRPSLKTYICICYYTIRPQMTHRESLP